MTGQELALLEQGRGLSRPEPRFPSGVDAAPPASPRTTPAPGERPLARSGVDIAVLAAALIACVALRSLLVGRSMWLDELITVQKVHESLPAMMRSLTDDTHPPLYYLSLRGWIWLFGPSAVAMRWLSILFSAVAMLATHLWAKEAAPRQRGLIAPLLVAIGPFALWYGTEIRSYSLVLALGACSGWLTWRVLRRGPAPGTVLALVVADTALLWTHYFGALLVGSLAVVAGWLSVKDASRRSAAGWGLAAAAISLLSIVPWLAYVSQHHGSGSASVIDYTAPDFYSALTVWLQMVLGFQRYTLLAKISAAWPVLLLILLAVTHRIDTLRWTLLGVAFCVVAPIAALVLESKYGPVSVFDPRYVAFCAIPLWILLGSVCEQLGARPAVVLGAIAIGGGAVLGITQNTSAGNPKLYDLQQAVATVNAHGASGDAVVLIPDYGGPGVIGEPVFASYRLRSGLRLIPSQDLSFSSSASIVTGVQAIDAVLQRTAPARLFLITDGSASAAEADRQRSAARMLEDGGRVVGRWSLPQADVIELVPAAGATG